MSLLGSFKLISNHYADYGLQDYGLHKGGYIYIYVCIWGCLSFYVYEYLDVEREKKTINDQKQYIYIYIYSCVLLQSVILQSVIRIMITYQFATAQHADPVVLHIVVKLAVVQECSTLGTAHQRFCIEKGLFVCPSFCERILQKPGLAFAPKTLQILSMCKSVYIYIYPPASRMGGIRL